MVRTTEIEPARIAPLSSKSFTIKALEKTKNFLSDSANNTLEAAVIVKKVPLSILGKGYLYVSGKGKSDNTTVSGIGIQGRQRNPNRKHSCDSKGISLLCKEGKGWSYYQERKALLFSRH